MEARLNLIASPVAAKFGSTSFCRQGARGLGASGRDAAPGEDPRQSDQWLRFLHRHAH
jgi:hypothetical protein